MTRSYEALLNHAMAGDNAGGVGFNRDVTLGSCGTVELAWQNGKTYESYERSYIKLEKNLPM